MNEKLISTVGEWTLKSSRQQKFAKEEISVVMIGLHVDTKGLIYGLEIAY